MSPSISSISARIGVIPMPPATSSTFSWLRDASVKTPNGPSATTRVPGLSWSIFAEWPPRFLIVMRNDLPSGADESENGSGAHQKPLVEEAPAEELPRRGAHLVEPAADDAQRDDARALVRRPRRCAAGGGSALMSGTAIAPGDQHERQDVEAAPVPLGRRDVDQVVACRDLVEPAERDAGVRGDVDRVPELVGDASPDEHVRRERNEAEQTGADRGDDHPGIDVAPDDAEPSRSSRTSWARCR